MAAMTVVIQVQDVDPALEDPEELANEIVSAALARDTDSPGRYTYLPVVVVSAEWHTNQDQRDEEVETREALPPRGEPSNAVDVTGGTGPDRAGADPRSAEEPIYPDIKVQLTGLDSNAGTIMGEVARALLHNGVPQAVIDEYRRESMSGDYDHLLRTAMKYVDVS